tara:strand:+ start:470 stop:673 length:204 start_codon:yes stop_codon:yes gene_type:complete
MKIKLLTSIKRNGQNYIVGDILDIPENNVGIWIKNGWGELIDKKEKKIKKETKELKIDSKQTKDEAN